MAYLLAVGVNIDLPTAEEVEEPNPDHGRGQEKLTRGRHEKQPGSGDKTKELDGGSGRRNVERKEGEEEQEYVLQI